MTDTPRLLCELMVEFGLSFLSDGQYTMHRPAMAPMPAQLAAEEKAEESDEEDALDAVLRMTPEQADRALRLAPTGRR
jgi:hypothetical protein